MTNTKKKGTSLVELLAVIVIMGIIAAIAVPTVGALLKNTRKKAAGSSIQQAIITTVDTYLGSASDADRTDLGWSTTKTSFEITFTGAEVTDTTTAIYKIFADEQDTAKNLTGKVTFTTNASGTKVTGVTFDDACKFTHNGHEYSGFTYQTDGTIKVSKEEK